MIRRNNVTQGLLGVKLHVVLNLPANGFKPWGTTFSTTVDKLGRVTSNTRFICRIRQEALSSLAQLRLTLRFSYKQLLYKQLG